jgi:hypothetical protein
MSIHHERLRKKILSSPSYSPSKCLQVRPLYIPIRYYNTLWWYIFPTFYNDIAPWLRFKKASNDAADKNIRKTKNIELPHILIYFDENSLNL